MAAVLTRMGKLKHRFGDNSGAEIAEAALVLPILFMILLGIYWFGRAFNVYATINHAAREGARAAIVSTCATCAAPANTPTVAAANAVTAALQASKIDPNQIAKQDGTGTCPVLPTPTGCSGGPSCSVSGNIQVCTDIQLRATDGTLPPVCGTSVAFEYPYHLDIPLTSIRDLCLKADVQMQGEN